MAEELKIRVSLNNAVFGELKQLEKKIQDFAQNANKTLKANLNFNPKIAGGAGSAGDPSQKIVQSIDRLTTTIRSTLAEVDRSIDAILAKIEKSMNGIFDNLFVGVDNLFKFGRRLRFRIGTFFGNAKATIAVIANDLLTLLREVSPFFLQFAKDFNKNKKEIYETIRTLSKFFRDFAPALLNAQQRSQKLSSQIQKFIGGREFQNLGNFARTRNLPLLDQVGIFFERARRFMNTAIRQIQEILETIRFVFNLGRTEVKELEKQAATTSNKLTGQINGVGEEVFALMAKVQKKVDKDIKREVQKQKSFIRRAFTGLFKGVFKLAAATLIAPFKLLALPFKLFTPRRGKDPAAEDPLIVQQRERKKREEAERRRLEEIEERRRKFRLRSAVEQERIAKQAREIVNGQITDSEKLRKQMVLVANQLDTIKAAIVKIVQSTTQLNIRDNVAKLVGQLNALRTILAGMVQLSSQSKVPEQLRLVIEQFEKIRAAMSGISVLMSKGGAERIRAVQNEVKVVNDTVQKLLSTIQKISSTANFQTEIKNVNTSVQQILSTIRQIATQFNPATVKLFIDEIKKMEEASRRIREQAQQAKKDADDLRTKLDFGETLKKVNIQGRLVEPLQKTIRIMTDIVEQVKNLDFSKFKKIENIQFGTKSAEFLNSIQNTFRAIARSQFQEKPGFRQQALETSRRDVGKLIEYFKILDSVIGTGKKELQKFGEALAKGADFSKFDKASQEAVRKVFKAFTGEELTKNKQLAEFGGAVVRSISESIRSGDKEQLRKSIRALTSFLGRTIPEKKRFVDSGRQISLQVAQGMKDGKVVLDKAADESAKTIGAYFPQSPAALGVLRKLPIMGKLINSQLATAIVQNLGILRDAGALMAKALIFPFQAAFNAFKKTLGGFKSVFNEVRQNAAQIGDIANVTGTSVSTINKLDSVFRSVGTTAKDNAIVFSRIQRTLNEVNPERESKLAQLGIDLDEIKASGDPVVELFKETADVLARVPPGSEAAKTAIEALGLTVDNKLVGALRQGGEQIDEIINKSVFFGQAVNTQVVKASQEMRAAFGILDKIFESIKADFIGEILPVVNTFLNQVIDFFNQNAPQIRKFFLFLGRFIGNLIRVVIDFFKLLVKEPKKAIEIAKKLLVAAINLVKRIVSAAISNISKRFTNELKYKASAALKALFKSAVNVLVLLGEQIDLRIAQVLLYIEKAATEIDTTIFDVGDTFVSTAIEVGKRWLSIAGAIIGEVLLSVENFLANLRDKFSIVLLGIKKEALETIQGLIEEIPESVREFFEIPSFSGGVSDVNDEIEKLERNIRDRNAIPDLFTRISNAITTVGSEIKSVDELLAEVNAKIEASKSKFAEGLSDNFKTAFEEAEALIEIANNAAGGIFDPEAIAEYEQALAEAKQEMIDAVAGTELEDSVRTLLDELSFDFADRLLELKDAAPAEVIEDMGEAAEEANESLEQLHATLDGLVELFQGVGTVVNNFASLANAAFEATGKQSRELFFASKAAAIGQAIINGAVAFTEALKQPFPLNIINPPLIAAKAGIQVGIIARQTIKGFAEGGEVAGEGTGDTVPAMLTPGEFVIPRDVVRSNGVQFMEAIRRGVISAKDFAFSGLPNVIHSPTNRRFADGGFVESPSKAISRDVAGAMPAAPEVNQTQINVPDISMVGRYMSTEKGRDVILNVISDNAVEIKQLMGVS